MSLLVEKPGLMTTLQDLGRRGARHLGVPLSGAADPLSLALANHLVGNPAGAIGIEMTLDATSIFFETGTSFALAGAITGALLNDQPLAPQRTHKAKRGDRLSIGRMLTGSRSYLAIAGVLEADSVFGSASTYVPAGLGGHEGRALKTGDRIAFAPGRRMAELATPEHLVPHLSNGWILRVVPGPEYTSLSMKSRKSLLIEQFRAGHRASRMGVELEGEELEIQSSGQMKSSPVFPGTVQCPQSGLPFLLMADAQVTGGYPRIAQVIRADRHLMGQIRPGDTVRFMQVTPTKAAQVLKDKRALYEDWFGYPAEFI